MAGACSSSKCLLGYGLVMACTGELEVDVLERGLGDREVPQLDPVLQRPRGDLVRRQYGLTSQDQDAVALQRALLSWDVRQIAERPACRQQKPDLGGSQITSSEL